MGTEELPRVSGKDLGAEGGPLTGMSSAGERRKVEVSSCDCCRMLLRLVVCVWSARGIADCEKRLLCLDADGSDGGCADLLEECNNVAESWESRV